MDPLDIVENLHKIRPVYQPVISAVDHTVTGYEVLGRFQHEGEWVSLGEFFLDPDVPDEYKIEADHYLLELAITELLAAQHDGCLFINRNAKQLLIDSGENFLQMLKAFEKRGFPMHRIVLEITEHEFDEDFEQLIHLLLYYKTYGIQIAVDHIGAKSSNIDRIRQLRPHILKIDTGLTRSHNLDSFQDIIYSLSFLARRIGAAFLFENIEDNHQLYFAWKHGGNFYQGNYLAEPAFSLTPAAPLAVDLGEKVKDFVRHEKLLVEERLLFCLSCEEKVRKLLTHWKGTEQADAFIHETTGSFDQESFRIYICDSDGLQVSSNFRKRNGDWQVQPDKKGANWSFRPYFLENMMHMRIWNKGILSDTYSDIETQELIRTFSFPLSGQHFLFIDLRYEFIVENDFLLLQ